MGGTLGRISEKLYSIIDLADIDEKIQLELDFLSNLSKIGEVIKKCSIGVSAPMKKWKEESYKLVNHKKYKNYEKRYLHYKNKLTGLVSEAENLAINGKLEYGGRKTRRIDRVFF